MRTRNDYVNSALSYYATNRLARYFNKWGKSTKKGTPFKIGVRKPFSFTQTKIKEEDEEMSEDHPQGFKTLSVSINTGNPPLRGMLKGNIAYRDTADYMHSWATGQDLFLAADYIGTRAQYLNTPADSVTNRTDVFYRPLYDLNPLAGIAASAIVPSNLTPNSDKIGISHGILHYDFVNLSSLPAVVKMHFFVAKDTTDQPVLEMYDDGAFNQRLYSTNYAYGANAIPATSGNETNTYGAATNTSLGYLYCMPYTNLMKQRIVRGAWKHLKTTKFIMSSADTQRVNVSMVLNQFSIREKTNEEALFPKGCLSVLLEYQGVAGKVVGAEEITLGGGKIGYVVTRKLKVAVMKAPNSRINTSYVGKGTVIQGGAVSTVEQFTEILVEQPGQLMT